MESPPKVGWTGRHAVELYVRTYTTMLQSSGDIKIESLVQAHLGTGSVLHPLAGEPQSDMGALLYAARRLPDAIGRCRHVVMGQSPQGFKAVLGAEIMEWQPLKAPARRRRWYQDGLTLAVLIASTSDIDDLVPSLVAYQIEWNKLHRALQGVELADESAREAAGASEDDWQRLHEAWGESFDSTLEFVQKEECHIGLRLIGGSHLGYARMAPASTARRKSASSRASTPAPSIRAWAQWMSSVCARPARASSTSTIRSGSPGTISSARPPSTFPGSRAYT